MSNLLTFEQFKKQILGGAIETFCTIAELRIQLHSQRNITLTCQLARVKNDSKELEFTVILVEGILSPDKDEEAIFIYKNNFVQVCADYYDTKTRLVLQQQLDDKLSVYKTKFLETVEDKKLIIPTCIEDDFGISKFD